jgi:hypothetical protein
MRKHPKKKISAITILVVSIIALAPLPLSHSLGGVRINDKRMIVITDAFYCDLDGDGLTDDVQTEFIVYSPTGDIEVMRMDFNFYLTLPSGKTFLIKFRVIEELDILPIVLKWYNVAEEEGWYLFTLDARLQMVDTDSNGRITCNILEQLEFDPPRSKDGDMPFGEIIY